MQNTYAVFSYGTEFTCRNFTDVDPDVSGVEITKAETGKVIGQIEGFSIPDIDDLDGDGEETIEFEVMVNDWLEENFW